MSTSEQDFQKEANKHYGYYFDGELRRLLDRADAGDEEAQTELDQGPLDVSKLTTDHRNETVTWEILLGTGGPAARVLVITDYDGNVQSASYQFQDWFQPWTDAEDQDEELVARYAQVFYYEPTEA
jgi:hypothetical protein